MRLLQLAWLLLTLIGNNDAFQFSYGSGKVSSLIQRQPRTIKKPISPYPLFKRDCFHNFASKDLQSTDVNREEKYVLYNERWLMMGILSLLALLSDWACFAAVGGTRTWIKCFNHNPDELIDLFLFSNVISCFLFTDVTRRFGLKNVTIFASGLMFLGCRLVAP